MTISLEHLADGSISDRNFQKLMSLVPDTGGQSVGVRFGVTTVTWAGASARSGNTVVSHGLGKTPVLVLTSPQGAISPAGAFAAETSFSIGATSFTVTAVTTDGSVPVNASTCTLGWIGIG